MTNNTYKPNREEVERREATRKRNDEELDKLSKSVCLIIGWSLVLSIFIYYIYLIAS